MHTSDDFKSSDESPTGSKTKLHIVKNKQTAINTEGFALSEALGISNEKIITFNQSIGIMLRAYTNAINKQNNTSGSLFRKQTKAECLNKLNGITPSFYNTNAGTKIHIDDPEKDYPQICFNYIHNNPVNAKLVKNKIDWEYSSAKDYAGLRNGKLINKSKAKEYIILDDYSSSAWDATDGSPTGSKTELRMI